MNIHEATFDEADAISEHVSAVVMQHIAPSLSEIGLGKFLTSLSVESTQRRILDGWPHFCAYEGQELIAVLVVKPPAHLYHFFVRADRQRQGVGKKLFSVADGRLREGTGCQIATVNSSLNAVNVYERLGFVLDGPIAEVDDVQFQPMVRRLTSCATAGDV